jgi:hypothetical protein
MSIYRRAARQDANQAGLVEVAEGLGAVVECSRQPLDLLVGWRGAWIPTEIKDPKGAGWADEFTPAQLAFMKRCKESGLPFWVWRSAEDVLRCLGARPAA